MSSLREIAQYFIQSWGATIVSSTPALLTIKGQQQPYSISEKLDAPVDGFMFCLNTPENVQELISSWDLFASKPQCKITFINPTTGNKWSIKPHIHDKISDKKTLKPGIMSLYQASLV